MKLEREQGVFVTFRSSGWYIPAGRKSSDILVENVLLNI